MMRLLGLICISLVLGCSSTSDGGRSRESAKVHTELAGVYFQRAQMGVALDEVAKALSADSDYAPAYGVRGLIHMSLREDKEAEDNFRKGLRLDKLDSDLHNNYGWFLCQRGREKESVTHFLAALKNPLYRTPGLSYLNAGICSQKIGEVKDAEEFYQKALVVQPEMPRALQGLAELNFASGSYNAARKYFLKMSARTENLTAEQLWLGVRTNRKLGDRNSEASYGMLLRKLFPDAPETQKLMSGE
ncbi:MAG: type IV pilus biogenesis/stability protein PilW [Gallionella sp.]